MNMFKTATALMQLAGLSEAVSIPETMNFAQFKHEPSCEDIAFNRSTRAFA